MERNLRIVVALLERGIHQYQLAHECGLTETRVSRIVRGREAPTRDEQRSIAVALGMEVAALFPTTEEGRS